MHIRQAEIAAAEAIGELFVVDAELVEDCGPEIVDGERLIDGVVTEFVGGAEDSAGLEAAASHPEAEAVGVVVASAATLGEGGAAELAGEDDNGALEQAALLEILQKRGNRLVDLVGHHAVPLDDVAVVIPGIRRVATAEVAREAAEFDETDTFLHEASRQAGLAH